jgi:hypothetical protein
MTAYSSGKHAFGICDRTGFRYRLHDLVPEIRNGRRTGLRVGRDVVDPDHPQNFLGRLRINDPQALRNPRPDADPGRGLTGWNPVGNPAQIMVVSGGSVTLS